MAKTMWDSLEETAKRAGLDSAHSVEYIGVVDLSKFPKDLEMATTYTSNNKALLGLPDTTVMEHGKGKLLIAVFDSCYIARKGSRWVVHYIPSVSRFNRKHLQHPETLNRIPEDMIRKEKDSNASSTGSQHKPEVVQA